MMSIDSIDVFSDRVSTRMMSIDSIDVFSDRVSIRMMSIDSIDVFSGTWVKLLLTIDHYIVREQASPLSFLNSKRAVIVALIL